MKVEDHQLKLQYICFAIKWRFVRNRNWSKLGQTGPSIDHVVFSSKYFPNFNGKFSVRGDIHTQVAMLNINMMFGVWGWGLLTLMLELWQNDIFLILM